MKEGRSISRMYTGLLLKRVANIPFLLGQCFINKEIWNMMFSTSSCCSQFICGETDTDTRYLTLHIFDLKLNMYFTSIFENIKKCSWWSFWRFPIARGIVIWCRSPEASQNMNTSIRYLWWKHRKVVQKTMRGKLKKKKKLCDGL